MVPPEWECACLPPCCATWNTDACVNIMKRIYSTAAIAGACLFVIQALMLSACHKESTPTKPVLIASIHPYALLLKELAGSEYEVRTLVPSNASPHTWSPVPSDLKTLSQASLILSNGLSLEANVEQSFALYKDKHINAADLLSDLIAIDSLQHSHSPDSLEAEHEDDDGHHHNGADPHLWTSPRLMMRLIPKLEKELSSRFPNSAFVFQRNAETMISELKAVDKQIISERSSYSSPGLITYHNSFHYFTEDYRINVLGWVQASPSKEPTPRELATLGNVIREHKVKALFLEPQMNRKAGEVLAREFKLKLLTLDPLGSTLPAKTISELILANWQSMKEGFSGE